MVWVAIDRTTGLPVDTVPPLLALQRTRRHRVDVNRLGRRLGTQQYWRQRFTCSAGSPDAGTGGPTQAVQVLYQVVHTPQHQGDGFEFRKLYFSDDLSLQWIHLRLGSQPYTWDPSSMTFYDWYC